VPSFELLPSPSLTIRSVAGSSVGRLNSVSNTAGYWMGAPVVVGEGGGGGCGHRLGRAALGSRAGDWPGRGGHAAAPVAALPPRAAAGRPAGGATHPPPSGSLRPSPPGRARGRWAS
jgi:hypothetical protein